MQKLSFVSFVFIVDVGILKIKSHVSLACLVVKIPLENI